MGEVGEVGDLGDLGDTGLDFSEPHADTSDATLSSPPRFFNRFVEFELRIPNAFANLFEAEFVRVGRTSSAS